MKMKANKELLIVFTILIFPVFGEDEKQDIYMQASKCPHRFHMGCMLDVVEKNCGALQVIEKCALKGECKNLDTIERILGALDPENFEALNRCCCSKAFKEGGYEDCKAPNAVCKKALSDHVQKNLKKNVKLLKKCLKKQNKAICSEALESAKWVNEAVQKARGEMWKAEGCQILAPPEPISPCGKDTPPESKSIERSDLYCDAIIWQFKEMGASDNFMAQCKDAPAMPEKAKDSEETEGNEGEEMEGNEGEEGEEEGEEMGQGNDEQDSTENDKNAPTDVYAKAASCPYRKSMGCFLHVIDKSCDASMELQECVNGPKCKKASTKRFLSALDADGKEFVMKCCCLGVLGYNDCKNKDPFCEATLTGERPKNFKEMSDAMNAYMKKPSKEAAQTLLPMIKLIRDGLQRARGTLWKNPKCQILAPMEPLITCEVNSKDKEYDIRKDIYCDTIVWKFAELGLYSNVLTKCRDFQKLEGYKSSTPEQQKEELEEQDDIVEKLAAGRDEL